MRIPSFIVLALCATLSGPSLSAELPAEIVGVWATPESELDSAFNLLGGLVLCVTPSGVAAIAGAPLPVMRNAGQVSRPLVGVGGSATYEASTGRLTIALRDGNRSRTVVADYVAADRTLVIALGEAKPSQLSRRSPVVPIALERALLPAPSPAAD